MRHIRHFYVFDCRRADPIHLVWLSVESVTLFAVFCAISLIKSFLLSLRMGFEKVKIEIYLAIRPKHLHDPSESIFKQLSKNLLIYSSTLGGFPLSFTIEGVFQSGRVLEDGSVYVNCLIEFCVLKIVPSATMYCTDGSLMGIFPVVVDDDEGYTGDFAVKGVAKGKIIGRPSHQEDSDF